MSLSTVQKSFFLVLVITFFQYVVVINANSDISSLDLKIQEGSCNDDIDCKETSYLCF